MTPNRRWRKAASAPGGTGRPEFADPPPATAGGLRRGVCLSGGALRGTGVGSGRAAPKPGRARSTERTSLLAARGGSGPLRRGRPGPRGAVRRALAAGFLLCGVLAAAPLARAQEPDGASSAAPGGGSSPADAAHDSGDAAAEGPRRSPRASASDRGKGRRRATREARARLLERLRRDPELRERLRRYRSLPPEARRKLLERFRRDLEKRTPAERARLRALARRLRKKERELAERRARLQRQPEARRKAYRKLLRQLLAALPQRERDRLATLDSAARREALRELVQRHRRRALRRHLAGLPEKERKALLASLRGLEGRARFQEVRRRIEGYARVRAQEILRDPDLAPGEKRAQLAELARRLLPAGPRRAAFLRRLGARLGPGGGPARVREGRGGGPRRLREREQTPRRRGRADRPRSGRRPPGRRPHRRGSRGRGPRR